MGKTIEPTLQEQLAAMVSFRRMIQRMPVYKRHPKVLRKLVRKFHKFEREIRAEIKASRS